MDGCHVMQTTVITAEKTMALSHPLGDIRSYVNGQSFLTPHCCSSLVFRALEETPEQQQCSYGNCTVHKLHCESVVIKSPLIIFVFNICFFVSPGSELWRE